jgi:ribosomal protein S18 acetylase RimI-like enzyme
VTGTDTLVRPATPADEPFLIAISARLADFPVPHWRTAKQIAEADFAILREALAQPNPETLLLIAELPDFGAAATVFATTRTDYFTGERHAHVEILAVDAKADGRGLARRLMEEAEKWSRARGYKRITLNVFDTNTRAAGLYEKLGYERETVKLHKRL